MFRTLVLLALASLAWHLAIAASDEPVPLLDGMGSYRGPTASRDAVAQRYFEQGVVLTWGFNPAEAARAFEAAARADPDCAMCWWGIVWSLGPNVNADVDPLNGERIASALAHAKATARTDAERALVAALASRHPDPRHADRVDEPAYARRMTALAESRRDDPELAFLAAESILDLHPYDWWNRDGSAKTWTTQALALLDRALALQPAHAGAHHYRIHVYESSPYPARALDSADALRALVPGSGHLVHMPAHIDMRTGGYDRAVKANEDAIEADRRYLAAVDAQGAYRVGYVAHNRHFLWAAAGMDGRSELALRAAQDAWPAACGPGRRDLGSGILQHYYVLPMFTLVRFARWNEILRDALPPDVAAPYPLAIWHYARGTAFARTSRVDQARTELRALERLARDPAIERIRVKNINPARAIVTIARLTLAADIAAGAGDRAQALRLLRQATKAEDALAYDEPHLWLAPTRHALGATLLDAGRFAEAERVYRDDLLHYPGNAWSLAGLAEALRGEGRTAEAADAERRRDAASARADVKITRSRL